MVSNKLRSLFMVAAGIVMVVLMGCSGGGGSEDVTGPSVRGNPLIGTWRSGSVKTKFTNDTITWPSGQRSRYEMAGSWPDYVLDIQSTSPWHVHFYDEKTFVNNRGGLYHKM